MKLLGIDYGMKRIGLAIADGETSIATPLKTIDNNDVLVAELVELCKERDVQMVVLGESKQFSGKDNPVMQSIRTFKQVLEERSGLPVVYIPEFFSSAQARRQPEVGRLVDGSAAAIILQSYLDSIVHEDN